MTSRQPAAVKNWVFTHNCQTEDEEIAPPLDPINYDFIVCQLEVAPETGQVHWQGYVQFSERLRLTAVKKLNPHAHWEPARGSPNDNINYCTKALSRKPGTEVWQVGIVKSAGIRSDLLALRDAVKTGKTRKDLFNDDYLMPIFARYPKLYDSLCLTYRRPPNWRKRKVIVKYGDTGTGKSRAAYEDCWDTGELWVPPISTTKLWFDGYDGERVVQLEDFAGSASHISLTLLLRLLDGYPMQVEIKGSFVWFDPHKIIITTNIKPTFWYDFKNRTKQYAALLRRFTRIEVYEDSQIIYRLPESYDVHFPYEERILD